MTTASSARPCDVGFDTASLRRKLDSTVPQTHWRALSAKDRRTKRPRLRPNKAQAPCERLASSALGAGLSGSNWGGRGVRLHEFADEAANHLRWCHVVLPTCFFELGFGRRRDEDGKPGGLKLHKKNSDDNQILIVPEIAWGL